MLNHNIVQSIPEAFEKFIGNHCPAFLPVETESPQQIYSLIHQAGGIGGIAHPGSLNQGTGLATNDLILHKQWGADFVEVYHPAHSEAQTEFYLLQTRKLGMAVAGGSDYHGYPTGNQREMAQKICPNWVLRSITQCHQNRQETRRS